MGSYYNMKKNFEYGMWKETLDRLNQPGFEADIGTYASLLRFCSNADALLDGKRVHNFTVKRGLEGNMLLRNVLVHMYSNCGALEDAHDLFSRMPHRDVFVCSFMMRAYSRHGHGKETLRVFEQVLHEGIVPNNFIFISVFTACASQASLAEGWRAHARIIGAGFKSDIAMDTALIDMYGKCGSPEYARWIFDQMPEQDAVSWNAMISVSLQHDLGKDALQLYHLMQHQAVTPTKVTFIHLFDACASQEAIVLGKQIHSCIMGSELESNIMVGTALVNMYGKCGCAECGQSMFAKMGYRDEVMWSTMISAYVQNGLFNDALHLFEQMQQEGIVPNKFIYSGILSGCASHEVLLEGKKVHARILRSGFELDVVMGNALLNLYGKLGRVEDAWTVFDKMLEWDLVSWNAMITAYAQHEKLKGALQVFAQMQREGVMVDKFTFLSILSVCASQAALVEGKRIHAYIAAGAINLDVTVQNALLYMYGKCGSLDYMCALFEEMSERTLVSWNTVIAIYAQNRKEKETFKLFDQMQGEGVLPDKLTFTSVLSLCASQGAFAEGKYLHEYFMKSGFASDFIVGSALVSLYGKCGGLKEARRMFDNMREHDVVIWNAMIAAYAHSGQANDVLQLFNQMKQEAVQPTSVTFISILFACSHAGLLNEACYYFNSMIKDYGIIPVVDHYNCMIDLLGRAGRLDEAEELLTNMSTPPSVASWMALLGACRKQIDVERAERTANKVFQLDPENPSPYVMLSNIYAAVGRVDDATKVLSMMKDKHLRQQLDCNTFVLKGKIHDFVNHQVHLKEEMGIVTL